MIFLDASVVVKVYVLEPGSVVIRDALARLKGSVFITRAVVLEAISTFNRKHRARLIPRRDYRAARASFRRDLAEVYTVLTIPDDVFVAACEVVERHPRIGAGALDVLHVASALDLQSSARHATVVVASSDHALLRLAHTTGMKTFDPEVDPLSSLLASVN